MAERNRFKYFRTNKVGRSSQLDEETAFFERKEEGSPRKMIYRNECPNELKAFEDCMHSTGNNLSACASQNLALGTCGKHVFKVINGMSEPYDYHKGLPK
mmetsp:Transcript_22489/g.22202  ORF Transcript_22489/g.22202 Transcript_22489/m.22202 type:complete len:100 (-) Transcript_22489:40-339(-)